MKFIRKHRKGSIAIVCILTLFLLIGVIFGRYIHNIIHNYILETQAFYFNSKILNINGKNYSISNWDGASNYPLTIDLNNRKTDGVHTMSDIRYNIYVECPDGVRCELSRTSGVLHPEDETTTYRITIIPLQEFGENDTVTVTTTVESTFPYHKTMSATYIIGVQTSHFSYELVDSPNSRYVTLNLTNAVSIYEAEEDFGDFKKGDAITRDEYTALPDEDKDKCFSAIVTVTYDPKRLFVDMSNKKYINRINDDTFEEVELDDGFLWVQKFSFKMNASSTASIIFYKDDVTEDFTYPIVNDESIIQVDVKLVTY